MPSKTIHFNTHETLPFNVYSVCMPRLATVMIVLAMFMSGTAYAQQSLAAAVSVYCPFTVSANSLPIYPLIGSLTMNYTIQTTAASCSYASLSGNVVLTYTSNSVFAYEQDLTASTVNNVAQTNNVVISTAGLSNTMYTATVNFKQLSFLASGTTSFSLISAPNLVISNVSVPSPLSAGSTLQITVLIENNGGYASSASTLFLSVNGPLTYSHSYSVPGISPGASSNVIITFGNLTQQTGTYTVTAYDNFTFSSNKYQSASVIANYIVTQSSLGIPTFGGGVIPGTVSTPIIPIPQLTLTTAPLIFAVGGAFSSLAVLGVKNTGTVPDLVNFTVDSPFTKIVMVNPSSLYLLPGQELDTQLNVLPGRSLASGRYSVPVNVTVISNGVIKHQTEIFTFDYFNSTSNSTQVISYISLRNYSSSAQGIIQIFNPTNKNITNLNLRTLIPAALLGNTSMVSAIGFPNTGNLSNGFYSINWQIPLVKSNSSVFAFYSISQPTSQRLLQQVQNLLVQPTQPSASIFKILSIKLSPLQTGAVGNVTIFSLYTGTTQQLINFTLSSAPGINIKNSAQIINATPNQLIKTVFNITTTSEQGTFLLNLVVSTKGYSSSYPIPLDVLPSSATPSGNLSALSLTQEDLRDVGIAILLIIIIVGIYLAFKERKGFKPKYNKTRAEQLVRIREQIKRGDEGEE